MFISLGGNGTSKYFSALAIERCFGKAAMEMGSGS